MNAPAKPVAWIYKGDLCVNPGLQPELKVGQGEKGSIQRRLERRRKI